MKEQSITEIVVATTNRGKLAELKGLLADHPVVVRGLGDFPDVPEAQETGVTFAENAREKALHYGALLKSWVLADDSGLQIDALNGEPGVYSARFAGLDTADGSKRDAANNRKVLDLLANVPTEKRTARFRCSLCLCEATHVRLEVEGHVEGLITDEPRGDNGFGYDPLFYLPSVGRTAAELCPEEKNALSHRGVALRKLLKELAPLLEADRK